MATIGPAVCEELLRAPEVAQAAEHDLRGATTLKGIRIVQTQPTDVTTSSGRRSRQNPSCRVLDR